MNPAMRIHRRHVDQAGVIGLCGVLYDVPAMYIGKSVIVDSVSLQLFPHYPESFADPVSLQIMTPDTPASWSDPHTKAGTGRCAGMYKHWHKRNSAATCECFQNHPSCCRGAIQTMEPAPPCKEGNGAATSPGLQ